MGRNKYSDCYLSHCDPSSTPFVLRLCRKIQINAELCISNFAEHADKIRIVCLDRIEN